MKQVIKRINISDNDLSIISQKGKNNPDGFGYYISQGILREKDTNVNFNLGDKLDRNYHEIKKISRFIEKEEEN